MSNFTLDYQAYPIGPVINDSLDIENYGIGPKVAHNIVGGHGGLVVSTIGYTHIAHDRPKVYLIPYYCYKNNNPNGNLLVNDNNTNKRIISDQLSIKHGSAYSQQNINFNDFKKQSAQLSKYIIENYSGRIVQKLHIAATGILTPEKDNTYKIGGVAKIQEKFLCALNSNINIFVYSKENSLEMEILIKNTKYNGQTIESFCRDRNIKLIPVENTRELESILSKYCISETKPTVNKLL